MGKITPHLTIYKFPLTAITSIINRGTGMYLTLIFTSFGIVSLHDDKILTDTYNSSTHHYKKISAYSLLFSTTYHTLGGVRHILWDIRPTLLTNPSIHKSSMALLFISTALTPAIDYIYNMVWCVK